MPSFLLGDGIELSTNDPVNLSFSDKELLDLQFTLQRLAALCAATGFPDDFYNDEDEDPEESSCCDTSGGGGLKRKVTKAVGGIFDHCITGLIHYLF